MLLRRLLFVTPLVVAFSTGANATIITTTSGSGDLVQNNGTNQVYEDDGVTMTLSAGLFTDKDAPAGSIVVPDQVGDAVVLPGAFGATPTPYSNGTGIEHNNGDGQHTIDGWYPEIAILEFDTNVQLKGVSFSYVDTYDTFDIFVDSNNDGILERIVANMEMPNNFYAYVDLLALDLVGTLFGIGASQYEHCYTTSTGQEKCRTKHPGWKLKKVKFHETPEIPIPAALPLFLAGLAGLGFVGRKKRAAS